jgi:hypothetical protein
MLIIMYDEDEDDDYDADYYYFKLNWCIIIDII